MRVLTIHEKISPLMFFSKTCVNLFADVMSWEDNFDGVIATFIQGLIVLLNPDQKNQI